MFDLAPFFSSSYAEARDRFKAVTFDAPLQDSLPLVDSDGHPLLGMEGEPLAIDIVGYGNVTDPSNIFIHTSGVHGVEGFAGSAIQLLVIEQEIPKMKFASEDCLLFIHAWNPFGMSWHRRWNENNVDLNRNFFPLADKIGSDPWEERGTSSLYREFCEFLNPPDIGIFDAVVWYIQAAYLVVKHGFAAIKQVVCEGQGDFSEGLFFGGRKLEQSNALVRDWFLNFLKQCHHVDRLVNINVHTGLGPFGEDSLLEDSSRVTRQMEAAFGDRIVPKQEDGDNEGVGYHVLGSTDKGLTEILHSLFPTAQTHCLTQEFGTYNAMSVLRALRLENVEWQHHKATTGKLLPKGNEFKQKLLEEFYVNDDEWRQSILRRGKDVFQKAASIAFGTSPSI